jgi:hypothetical protein
MEHAHQVNVIGICTLAGNKLRVFTALDTGTNGVCGHFTLLNIARAMA